MAEEVPQNFENHARFVLPYHGITFGILVINLLWSVVRLVRAFGGGRFAMADAAVGFLLAAGLLGIFFYARLFALTAQDRIIRLEERLRLERLLPADLRGRILEFGLDQLIALRFASDEELPVVARKVLDDGVTDRAAIKRMIKSWRPDHLRV